MLHVSVSWRFVDACSSRVSSRSSGGETKRSRCRVAWETGICFLRKLRLVSERHKGQQGSHRSSCPASRTPARERPALPSRKCMHSVRTILRCLVRFVCNSFLFIRSVEIMEPVVLLTNSEKGSSLVTRGAGECARSPADRGNRNTGRWTRTPFVPPPPLHLLCIV